MSVWGGGNIPGRINYPQEKFEDLKDWGRGEERGRTVDKRRISGVNNWLNRITNLQNPDEERQIHARRHANRHCR